MFIEALKKPIFKVGDTIKYKPNKGGYTTQDKEYKIAAIEDGKYIFGNLKDFVPIGFQKDFELA